MNNANVYCTLVVNKDEDDVDRIYHDTAYGFPIEDDNALFGRLVLEINQAGTSWIMVLNKKNNFYKAYHGFDIETIANYTAADHERLLNDKSIIRNKLKINAVLVNAQRVLALQKEYGLFQNWLDAHHPQELKAWQQLFKQNFSYTGGEITKQFLMSTSYLEGAHRETCPIYEAVLASKVKWISV